MPEKFHYSAYGLHIIADRLLPEILPASAPKSDANSVSIHLSGEIAALPMQPEKDEVPFYTHPHRTKDGTPSMEVWRNNEHYLLRYFNGSQFVISQDGKNIWAGWAADTDFSIITAIILGPILGLVLRLRGLLILHASVVADDDHALAIVGTSGAGKSTTAAELCRQGFHAISDDIAALDFQDGSWWAQPGYPRLRLRGQSADALSAQGHKVRRIAPAHESWHKCYLELDGEALKFSPSPKPLRAIYILDWTIPENDKVKITPVQRIQALTDLDGNAFLEFLLDREERKLQIHAIARLLNDVSVFHVQPTPGLTALPDLAKTIGGNFSQLGEHLV